MMLKNRIDEFLNNKIVRLLCIGFVTLLGLLAIYSFIKTPFTGDIKVFMAAANQAKYKDSGLIMSIFEAWELKGIASRLFIYVIYAVADFFVGFENKMMFELACKLVYAVILVIIFALSVIIMPTDNKNRALIFGIMFFAFFATGTASQLQVEMTCVAICLLAAACLIRNKTWSLALCGALCSLLFFFKSIFILLFASVLLCGALYNSVVKASLTKRSFTIPVVSFFACELVLIGLVAIVYPQEFADMAQASEYQSTLLSESSNVTLQSISTRFIQNFTLSVVMIPILIIGVVGSIHEIIRAVKEKNNPVWICLSLIWILSADIIIVSNTYFIYHYFLLALPAIIGTIMYFKHIERSILQVTLAGFAALSAVTVFNVLLGPDYKITAINNSTVLLVCLHLFAAALVIFTIGKYKKTGAFFSFVALTVCFFLWSNFLSALAPYYKNLRTIDEFSYISSTRDIPKDIGEGEVLFLDSGAAAFYIDAPSYSRYFFNLPLQRWTTQDKWEWKDTEYQKALAFDGKYVVVDYGWMNMNNLPELNQKLNSEYTVLETQNLRVWSPYWQWYDLQNIDVFTDNDKYKTGLKILVRK